MLKQAWKDNRRKTIVCLDSYDDGVAKGRIYLPYQQMQPFESLSQFLVKMQRLLDDMQMPQSGTEARTFCSVSENCGGGSVPLYIKRGSKATFEVRVFFRQHSSWQGMIVWLEQNMVQSFRSVLELIMLMDSVLRSGKGSDTA